MIAVAVRGEFPLVLFTIPSNQTNPFLNHFHQSLRTFVSYFETPLFVMSLVGSGSPEAVVMQDLLFASNQKKSRMSKITTCVLANAAAMEDCPPPLPPLPPLPCKHFCHVKHFALEKE